MKNKDRFEDMSKNNRELFIRALSDAKRIENQKDG